MSFADKGGNGAQSISLSLGNVLALFIVGVASAAAMVVPGVSGSLLMLILGFYYAVIYTINQFTWCFIKF